MKNRLLLWRALTFDTAIMILLFDQLSKYFVMTGLFQKMYSSGVPDMWSWLFSTGERLMHPEIKITDWFNMVMVWNPGVSFGMLQTDTPIMRYALALFAVLVCAGFLVWAWREPRAMITFPIGLIVGGALGNVWDRLRFGAVVDFLDVHVAGHHWPAFNVADSAVTIGVVLLLIDQLVLSKRAQGVAA